jgi:hypothetical protein
VNENMSEQVGMVSFVQNIPIDVLTFIERGVMHYGGEFPTVEKD